MRYYNIDLSGYGGEVVYGKLTKEQHDFWHDKEESDITAHAFWDPYDEGDENLVQDEDDPRWLGYWHDLDDIVHLNGGTMSDAWITVEEVSSADYAASSIKEIVDRVDVAEFIKTNKNELTQEAIDLDDYANEDGHNYIFYGMSIEKGQFHLSTVELPDDEEFDLSKINFCATELDNGDNIVEVLSYGDIDLDNVGGDSTGKGYSTTIFDY